MPSPSKEGEKDVYGVERCRVSCGRVGIMMASRPWVVGQVMETEQFGPDDAVGIDMFAPFDQRLVDLLCMEQEPRGMKIQIKSERGKENRFRHKHKEEILNLASGENIFVFNGQEKESIMLATLVGQIVAMASLSGSIPERLMLDFMANDLHDEKAVLAYIKHREYLLRNKWFKRWLDGSIYNEEEQWAPKLLI